MVEDLEFRSEKKQLSDMVKRLRAYYHLSQRDLSKLSGISQADISKIERGLGNPSLSTISRIMSATGNRLNMDYVIASDKIDTLTETKKENLDSHILQLTEESALRIRSSLGEKVSQIILFGSCARGENTKDSDVDIALILKGKYNHLIYENSLSEISADMMDKYHELVNFVCLSSKDYNEKKVWYPFYMNIEKEGILF